MIYFLIAIIVLLCLTIFALSVNFRSSQRSHLQKVNNLQDRIVALHAETGVKRAKLALADDLREKLAVAREKLDRDIWLLQLETIETLFKNNVIT